MRSVLVGIAMAMAVAMPAGAEEQPDGRALAQLSFEALDEASKGYLDQGDMEVARRDIFTSMDADDSNSLEQSEFLNWGYGFQSIAEDEGKQLAYDTALKVVFSFWDRDGDGKITQTEHRKAVMADFNRADLNSNAVLEKSEFLGGFSVLVAIRAALKPE